MQFTHEEIIKLLRERKAKLNIKEMAKHLGICNYYLGNCINEKKAQGRVQKIHKKHFPAIIDYLNGIAVKDFASSYADEILKKC